MEHLPSVLRWPSSAVKTYFFFPASKWTQWTLKNYTILGQSWSVHLISGMSTKNDILWPIPKCQVPRWATGFSLIFLSWRVRPTWGCLASKQWVRPYHLCKYNIYIIIYIYIQQTNVFLWLKGTHPCPGIWHHFDRSRHSIHLRTWTRLEKIRMGIDNSSLPRIRMWRLMQDM